MDRVLGRTTSGGACVNDLIVHLATDMPFGGVGASGMGAYHGKYGFSEFSHMRSTLWRSTKFDLLEVSGARYAPYTKAQTKELKMYALRGGILPTRYARALKLAAYISLLVTLVKVKKVRV